MKKGLYKAVLCGIAAALVIFGCDVFLGPGEPAGAGNLVIGFGESGGASRAVAPTPEEQAALRYDLVLTGPGGQTKTVSLSLGKTFNEQVALGEWRIYAEAYSPGNTLTGTGSAAVTVRAGKNEARVPMRAVTLTPFPGARMTPVISGVSVPFRYVPAGSFQRDATPANVTIITRGYWMGETEVTQELFQAVIGTNPSDFNGSIGKEPEGGETQNQRPVEQVSWYEAIAFCNKLSLVDGKDPVYSVTVSGTEVPWATLAYGAIPPSSDADWDAATMDTTKNGYRLPTEMEWMWAAMGADKSVQPNTTGYDKAFAGSDGSNNVDDYAWYNVNSGSKTHEVGKKAANELGLYDMSGNVLEWCWDWYGSSYGSGDKYDPQGASSGPLRVHRGGSWNSSAAGVRSAYRSSNTLSDRYNNLGFRLVRPQF